MSIIPPAIGGHGNNGRPPHTPGLCGQPAIDGLPACPRCRRDAERGGGTDLSAQRKAPEDEAAPAPTAEQAETVEDGPREDPAGFSGDGADQPSAPAPLSAVEADDDPHRLARLYIADHTRDDGLTLRWWRGEFHS